jgi:hypothetical protein
MKSHKALRIYIAISITLLAFTTQSFAQMGYQSGSVTLNDGKIISCQIKIGNPRFSPAKIIYKTGNNTKAVTVGPEDIRGFSIGNGTQFVSAYVQIDISTEVLRKMNTAKLPSWKVRTVFLKKVLDSNTSLFLYKSKEYERFFYQTGKDGKFTQLIYKHYLLNRNSSVTVENLEFRNQLKSDFDCLSDQQFIETLKYTLSDLTEFFKKHNQCNNYDAEVIKSEKLDRNLTINLKAGFGFTRPQLQVKQFNTDPQEIDVREGSLLRLDFEFEYKIGLGKNPLAFFAGLGLEKYSGVGIWEGRRFRSSFDVNIIIPIDQRWETDIFSLGLNFGVRKYFFMNESTQLFTSATIVPSFTYLMSDIEISPSDDPRVLEFEQRFKGEEGMNYAFGFGVKHKSILLELRYFSKKEILDNSDRADGNYSNLAFTLGLSL